MDEGYTWLKGIADRMKSEVAKGAAPGPERLTVRKMLEQFGYQRRSDGINNHIRNVLEEFMLRTNEDFTAAWPDSPITIELDSDAAGASAAPRTSDPTHRVSAFLDRKSPPASVKPESSLKEATTIMQMNHYSRLPVMKNEREVSGIVTWQSIGTRLALGLDCTYVRQCMQPAEVIPADTRLFDAVNKVAEHGYVLVRGEKNVITGIVTGPRTSRTCSRNLPGRFCSSARSRTMYGTSYKESSRSISYRLHPVKSDPSTDWPT